VRKRISPGVVLGVVAIVFSATGSAVAGSLITTSQIKNGTISNRDIRKGTISLNRLTIGTRRAIAKAGKAGPAGPKGDTGATGAPGTTTTVQGSPGATPTSGNWGIVDRNTIGSPQISLRSGPATPPLGEGSLNFVVKDGTEKAAYGNEVDSFAGGLVKNITAVGFRVYTTGEDISAGGATPNMPSISFEIDPNVAAVASDYSSLVYMPANSTPNQWSPYIDATTTGLWGLTGSKFAGTPCDINGNRCTFAQVQAYLNDGGDPATILTASITKGRDFSWQGAVDGLRINSTVLDFEENGVFPTTA
jgi:hypothetical protein